VRIRAERDDLVDVLSRAARAVSPRSPLPILQGLLVSVVGHTLRVTGTDLDMTVRTQLDVEVLEEGRTVVPGRLITEAARKLPAGAVLLAAGDGEVELTGGGPRFRFRELAADDFPVIAEPRLDGALEVDGDDFLAALDQVVVAASRDDARPVLTGVYFESTEGALRLVATDSYRLALRDLPLRGHRPGPRTGAPGVDPHRGDQEDADCHRCPGGILHVEQGQPDGPAHRGQLPELPPASAQQLPEPAHGRPR
jgi:DNA polymerase-3 subunit beta